MCYYRWFVLYLEVNVSVFDGIKKLLRLFLKQCYLIKFNIQFYPLIEGGIHARGNFAVKKSYISPIGLQLAPRIKKYNILNYQI